MCMRKKFCFKRCHVIVVVVAEDYQSRNKKILRQHYLLLTKHNFHNYLLLFSSTIFETFDFLFSELSNMGLKLVGSVKC